MSVPLPTAPRRLLPNVLVYTGPGTSRGPVDNTLYTLRSLLSARYDVIPVAAAAISTDTWQASTACIVVPGGRDEPYVAHLQPEATRRIAAYVRAGGSYLGICAGAYFACKGVEFEVGREGYGVVGAREMRFFPGTAKGSVAPGFVYGAEDGAAAMPVYMASGSPPPVHLYVNGGPWFDATTTADAEDKDGNDSDESAAHVVETLAWYDPDAAAGSPRRPAIVDCKVGAGRAVLSGPHFEYPASATAPPLNALLAPSDDARVALASEILSRLGLEVNDAAARADALADLQDRPVLSEMHLCMDDGIGGAHAVEEMMARLGGVRDVVDTVNVLRFAHASASQQQPPPRPVEKNADAASELPAVDILIHPPNTFPTSTPFDFSIYFTTLAAHRRRRLQQHAAAAHTATFGSTILYGRTVTSTQTLLEKNSTLSASLPPGLVCTATHQIAGRGRGANAWISPPGALMFSLAITHAVPTTAVFVQYLMALAVVEAVKVLDAKLEVGIKWPNDVYARKPRGGLREEEEDEEERRAAAEEGGGLGGLGGWVKIGGILVSSCFEAGVFRMVVGCGLNLANSRPTLSITELLRCTTTSSSTTSPPRIDATLALIVATFDSLYTEFANARSFTPFLDRYYAAWLHSNQIVTLHDVGGVRARITGIDEFGLLRAVTVEDGGGGGGGGEGGGVEHALQPDGNSFDMMRGMISRKK
ncbi:biotin holocarboxylase synthetase [Geranomyces variabilis]|uniref:Biotin holocarboxylase synthetase n=1 Tax=Geranomyces variabilis TaxID=109894 RepID=A0AAD5TEL8_9FUNG|nr:biotin holocarboxylase synthetase [Geranomyces variabilis]